MMCSYAFAILGLIMILNVQKFETMVNDASIKSPYFKHSTLKKYSEIKL